MKCCNKELKLQKGKSEGKELVYYLCPVCKKGGKGKNEKEALNNFNENVSPVSKEITPLPKNKTELLSWSQNNMSALINQSAQFIDKPATKRMIEKNIKYVASLSGKSWDKIWNSPEGQESIKDALSDALYYAATLPEMGSIVPFGQTAEFIPAIECYEHALTVGKNAPFREISITPVHENDQHTNEQKDGHFIFNLIRGIPRGETIAVVVQGIRNDVDKNIGEIYDIDYLIKKAEDHSPSYRQYIIDLEDFTRMKIEGKLKKDYSGREYFEKKIEYKKDGKDTSFIKKVFEYEISNPYDCSDKIKMFMKSAGKSFFVKYMKVRNAAAMADEWNGDDIDSEMSRNEAADNVLKQSANQFDNVVDGEIIPEKCKDGCSWSRSMDQEYPRKCVVCGYPEPEKTDQNKTKEGDIGGL